MKKKFDFDKAAKRLLKSNIERNPYSDFILKFLLVVLSVFFLVSFWMFLDERNKERARIIRNKSIEYAQNNSKEDNETRALEEILRNIDSRTKKKSEDVYVWDDNGRIKASNINHPESKDEYQVVQGVSSSERETPYTKIRSGILIPVTIVNDGKVYTVKLVLDTGCTTTFLDSEITSALNFRATGSQRATLADGSNMISYTGKVDLIEIGPYKEYGFLISTGRIQGRNKTSYGLLGMNFLENHPFSIDRNRQVIIWE